MHVKFLPGITLAEVNALADEWWAIGTASSS